MTKLVLTIISLLLSVVMVAGGGIMSFQKSDFGAIMADFEEAVKIELPAAPETPVDPELPGDVETPVDPENPGDDEVVEPEKETSIFSDIFDSYNPEFADLNKQVLSNAISSVIPEGNEGATADVDEILSSYVDNLYAEIDRIQTENPDATEEELNAARDEFAQKEDAAFQGLTEIMSQTTMSGEAPNEETVVESVNAILNSTVCLGTVTDVVTSDSEVSNKIEESTNTMTPEIKTQIENIINEAYTNPENAGKEEDYKALASLFGITLGGSSN